MSDVAVQSDVIPVPMLDVLPVNELVCASRQNMDAMVALRMVSFPVPPLPLLANQGEDSLDSTASSWDLLAAALRCQLLQPKPMELDEQQRVGEAKGRLLVDMFTDVVAVWQQVKTAKLTEKAAIERCYSIFQHTFRQYFAFFPGSSDLRFRPLDDVDQGSPVHTQAMQFLRNQAYTVVDDDGVLTDIGKGGQGCTRSYKQCLQRYVEELHAQAQDYLDVY